MALRFDDLIGKPYLDGGVGPDHYDCYGLTLEIFKRLGWPLDIPAEVLYNFGSSGFTFLRRNPGSWKIVDHATGVGDLALIRGDNKDCTPDGKYYARHLAIFIGEDKFIHCTRKTGVSIIRWKILDPFTLFLIRYIPRKVTARSIYEN